MLGAVYTVLGIGLVLIFRHRALLNLASRRNVRNYWNRGGAGSPPRASTLGWVGDRRISGSWPLRLDFYYFVVRPRSNWPQSTLILISLAAAFVARGCDDRARRGPIQFHLPPLFSDAVRIAGGAMPPTGIGRCHSRVRLSAPWGYFVVEQDPAKELLVEPSEDAYAARGSSAFNVERGPAYGLRHQRGY